MTASDLQVSPISESLADVSLDLVVSGSIGAVESVRFIRSLRRLGARVTPWLSQGGQQFITETSLAWAAATPCVTRFSGEASHIALGDACVVAPASASLIGKIAGGLTDSPEAALITSYLGMGKPVILVPNMHDSLLRAPQVEENLRRISQWVKVIEARREEGKHKFPDPATLADRVSHELNRARKGRIATLVSMGTTRGYIDDVRYFSNYSSGALGSAIAEELYRNGVPTHVVSGPAPIQPRVTSSFTAIETNAELADACRAAMARGCQAAVLAASVLDFIPEGRVEGKISSASQLEVKFQRAQKIIAEILPSSGIKVGFKLEADLDEAKAGAIAADYFAKYQLSFMVLNALSEVDATRHQAHLFSSEGSQPPVARGKLAGKQAIAKAVARHVIERAAGMTPRDR